MEQLFSLLAQGFSSLFTFEAFIAMVVGVTLGTIFGAFPGLSATTGMAMLLPICYGMEVSIGLLMLGGIYAGALYGGSISAILLGIPGTAAALPTTFDGYPLSREGHSHEALLAGLYGSSAGGVLSAIVLMFLIPPIAAIAIRFGPPEMFMLGLWGISMVTSVIGGDIVKGLFMAVLGLIVGMVGADPSNGFARFTFGNMYLYGGFSLVPLILGTLALPRVYEIAESFGKAGAYFKPSKENKYFLKPREVLSKWFLILRSAIVGIVVGIAPAAGPTIASFMSYNMAKKASKSPETFGKGNIEGVWASETANNGATGGSLVFALSLGIPGSPAAAVLMSALIMRGVQPGPLLLINNSNIVYTFFAGFLVVNMLVFVIGHLFVKTGASILRTPIKLLAPAVLIICVIGAFSDSNSMFGVFCAFGLSIVGYFLEKLKFPMGPFLLSLVLVNVMEQNLWATYAMTFGDLTKVFHRPMFLILLAIAILSFVAPVIIPLLKKNKVNPAGR